MATKHTDEELERRVKIKELEEKALEQKRLKDALSDSEEKYPRLAKDIFEGIYCVDTHGVMTYVSPATESLLGYRSEEIINRPFTDFIFPQDLHHMKKRFQDALNGNGEPAEYRILKKSGGYRWVRAFSKPVFVEDTVVTIQGVLMDITESKKAEEALRESEAQKKAILDASVDRIRLVDTDLRIIWANKTTTRELNRAPEDLAGQPCYKVFFDNDASCSLCPSKKAVVSGNMEHSIIHHLHSKGIEGETYWDNYAVPIKNERGDVDSLIQITRNITEQVQAERALKESKKELENKAKSLEESNIALRVLLKRREEDKKLVEEKVLFNIRELVVPHLERLKKSGLDKTQHSYVSALESDLNDIVSPFSRRLSTRYLNLTPSEIQISNLIRQGKTTKDIANFLGLSSQTIEGHRKNIRKKLGIKNKKANLRSHLQSIQ